LPLPPLRIEQKVEFSVKKKFLGGIAHRGGAGAGAEIPLTVTKQLGFLPVGPKSKFWSGLEVTFLPLQRKY